jgi:signal transduction histidine kinase
MNEVPPQMHPSRSHRITLCHLLWWLPVFLFIDITAIAADPVAHTIQSLAELQNLADTNYQTVASVSVSGVVCAAVSASGLVALQDDTATVLLQLPYLDPKVRPGDRLALNATQITLMRNAAGVLVGTAPVAEIDGLHFSADRSGRVFLPAGWQPLRVEWFKGGIPGRLDLFYEGPGVSRQRVPDTALGHRAGDKPGSEGIAPGLNSAVYSGTDWNVLPEFQALTPTATGTVPNFDARRYMQTPPLGVQFSGFLRISNAGIYTFELRSEDGARLFVGDPAMQCTSTRLGPASPPPMPISLAQALAGQGNQEWVSLEGKVTFASRRGSQIELDIMDRDQPVSVLIASGARIPVTNLPNERVRVTGICLLPQNARTPRVIVPGGDQLKIIDTSPDDHIIDEPITTAAQVRTMQPADARRHLHAIICGVVTTATLFTCVVQDSTGPVFVRSLKGAWPNQPIVGERWTFKGTTDPGAFSPIVFADTAICMGRDVMPQPIHPNREQLLDGSLDVELVEVPGIVLDMTPHEITLFTPGETVKLELAPDFPSPSPVGATGAKQSLIGSRVRVRGVFFAWRVSRTRQLVPGQFLLGDPVICVDDPAPADPFSVQTRRLSDLLRFTSHVDVLTRFKVKGQVLLARPGEYLLTDGAIGFRAVTKKPLPIAVGDLVEAVGFPQLGGPSPVLIEADARKIGSAPLPPARPVSAMDLSNEGNDATRVQVDALLVGDEAQLGERVLELQAGLHHFLARLQTAGQPAELLRPGSLLRITGIYRVSAGNQLDGFELLLNSRADITVLAAGPWWTMHRIMAMIAILLAALGASLIWVLLLRRTVTHRTALLAQEIRAREQITQRRLLEQERARVAQDLHDDLGAGLAQIGLVGALAQRANTLPDRARTYMSEITDKSRDMVTALDEIVWAINPKHDTASSVSGYLCDYAQEFLRPTGIMCRLDTNGSQPSQFLNSAHRHQLFLAFKEALTNVVKHADAAEVWVRIAVAPGEVNVRVEDNGKGISPRPEEPKGDGTVNMRTRLEQMGGTCEITPRPGGGTVVSFHLPTN